MSKVSSTENNEKLKRKGKAITLIVSKVRDEIEDMLKTVESGKTPKEEL